MNEILLDLLLNSTKEAKLILRQVIKDECIAEIDLSDLQKSHYSVVQKKTIIKNLIEYLYDDNIIRSINLSSNLIGLDAVIMNMLCHLIRTNTTLININLSYNALDDEYIVNFSAALSRNQKLISLKLIYNNLSRRGAELLYDAISSNIDILHKIKILITCNNQDIPPILVSYLFFPERRLAQRRRSLSQGMYSPLVARVLRSSVEEIKANVSHDLDSNELLTPSIESRMNHLLSESRTSNASEVDGDASYRSSVISDEFRSLLNENGSSKHYKDKSLNKSSMYQKDKTKRCHSYTLLDNAISNETTSESIMSHAQLSEALSLWRNNSNKAVKSNSPIKQALRKQAQIQGFDCIDVPGDGACFFYAVSDQLRRIGIIKFPQEIRERVVDHLLHNIDEYKEYMCDPDKFMKNLVLKDGEADNIAINVTSRILNLNIFIIRSDGGIPTIIESPFPKSIDIYIGYEVGIHYQSLIKSNIESSRQSIEINRFTQ